MIRDLGTLGFEESTAAAINNRGQVVGGSYTDPASDVAPISRGHAFLWERGVMRDLGTLGGDCPSSEALAINDQGQIAGLSGTYSHCSYHDYQARPVLWQDGRARPLADNGVAGDVNSRGQVLIPKDSSLLDAGYLWENGTLITLTLPRGWTFGNAVDLNDRGQVLLDTENDTNDALRIHTFAWQDRRMRDLGTLPGWRISRAVAINDNGTAVGNAYPSHAAELKDDYPGRDTQGHAVVWRHGKIDDLGTLGGNASHAIAISADEQIVGWSETRQRVRHAFLWRHAQMHDLGTLPGRRDSEADAINERGVVVGNSFTLESGDAHAVRAFVWQKGELTDLRTLPGGKESAAVAINNRNQIVGWSTTKSGHTHAVLWALQAARRK